MAGELERLLIRLEADTAILRREFERADKKISGFTGNVDRHLSRTERRFQSFARIGNRALAGLTVGFLVKETGELADAYTNMTNRLKFVTSSSAELAYVQDRLFKQAQETRVSLTDASELYSRMAFALRNAGVSTNEVLQFTENLNKALILSGASGAEASGALVQLSQGLASGTLRGQELNSILEQLPFVAELIARKLGVTTGELRKLGEQGKITGREVFEAVTDATQELDEKFSKTVPTLAQGFTTLGNSLLTFVGRLDASTGASSTLASALQKIAGALDSVTAAQAKSMLLSGPSGAAREGALAAARDLGLLPPEKDTPLNTTIGDKRGKRRAGAAAAVDYTGADALAKLRIDAAGSGTGQSLEAIRLSNEQELERFRRLLEDKKISEEQFAEARALIAQRTTNQVSKAYATESAEARKHFAEVEALIENSFMNAFDEALETGKFKAGEFFAELTKGFAKITLQALVLKPIMDSLFNQGGIGASLLGGLNFAGARAAGGPVYHGKAHLVGERGPELFVPNTGGRIMNARDTRSAMGSVTNNYIDARGADISVAERIERALIASERSRREPVSAVGGHQRRHPYRYL